MALHPNQLKRLPTNDDSLRGCEVVTLPGGELAIKDRRSGQIMHCGTGPAVEPTQIYVKPSRLAARLLEGADNLVLYDGGLGAASNALAAWHLSENAPAGARRLEIVSFDNELDSLHLALKPENRAAFGFDHAGAFEAASTLAEKGVYETGRTLWRLHVGDVLETLKREPPARADIIFWDMYSYRSTPTLWTVAAFRQLRAACRDGATLHTTSAGTASRSSMLLGGFAVGMSGGAGNRRTTTVACTTHTLLENPLDARWLLRLSRSAAGYFDDVPVEGDARAKAFAQIAAMPQFQGAQVP